MWLLMIKVALFAGGDLRYFAGDFDYFVGVDRGSLYLIEQGFPLNLAVGDFDSISAEELKQVTSQAECLIQAPAEKDDTDTELALKTIFKDWPEAQVTIFGAFGGRLDHLMSNLFLPSEPKETIEGVILDVPRGVSQIGQFDVVTINKGARDGLVEGNVLAVYKTGETVRDNIGGDSVKIPDERSGLLMVFRTYDKLSYGLVLYASRQLAVMDKVKNP